MKDDGRSALEKFEGFLGKILRVPKKELDEALEAEKRAAAQLREAIEPERDLETD